MIVGIAGYARTGKDTLANEFVKQLAWTRHGFADALRECLYALDPLVTIEDGQTWGLARVVDMHGWEEAKNIDPSSRFGTRSLLQRLGTDVGREILGDTIWTDVLMAKVSNPDHSFVVPDVRFPNEADAIRGAGGIIVRVVRNGFGPANTHPSETAMDDYDVNVNVLNDGTPTDMLDAVLRFIPTKSE